MPSSTPLDPAMIDSCAEVLQVANLPFHEANRILSLTDNALKVRCFSARYRNFGYGYLHSSDHYGALQLLLNREPTFLEVYDSYHLHGSDNIDKARELAGPAANERPYGWESWNYNQKLLAVLTKLYGMSVGARILDGKRSDPSPDRTRALMLAWGLSALPSDPPPVQPDELDQIRALLSPIKSIDLSVLRPLIQSYANTNTSGVNIRSLLTSLESIQRIVSSL